MTTLLILLVCAAAIWAMVAWETRDKPVDIEEVKKDLLRRQSDTQSTGNALALRREARTSLEAYLHGLGKPHTVVKRIGDLFSNPATIPAYLDLLAQYAADWFGSLTNEQKAHFAPVITELQDIIKNGREAREKQQLSDTDRLSPIADKFVDWCLNSPSDQELMALSHGHSLFEERDLLRLRLTYIIANSAIALDELSRLRSSINVALLFREKLHSECASRYENHSVRIGDVVNNQSELQSISKTHERGRTDDDIRNTVVDIPTLIYDLVNRRLVVYWQAYRKGGDGNYLFGQFDALARLFVADFLGGDAVKEPGTATNALMALVARSWSMHLASLPRRLKAATAL